MTPDKTSHKPNPSEVVFSPQQASVLAVKSVEMRRDVKNSGLKTGIADVDRDFLPMRPGELISVLAYTSNYKSGTMSYIAKSACDQIDQAAGEIVIYLSWEQSVEEQALLDISYTSNIDASRLYRGDLSELQWAMMMKASVERAAKPLWLIGHSENSGNRRPRLSLTDVANALAYIVDVQKRRPRLILLDYLQRINRDDCRSTDLRVSTMEVVDRAKDMSLAFTCPVMLGTQAGRQVLERNWKMPTLADSLESSNLEQSSDKVMALWYPKTTEPANGKIRYTNKQEYTVTDNLLLMSVLKQKYGRAPVMIQLHVQPEVNRIYGVERQQALPVPQGD